MGNVTISNVLYHFTGFGGAEADGQGKTTKEAFETLKKILHSSHLRLCKNEVSWGYADEDGRRPFTGLSFSPHLTCFSETPIEYATDHTRSFGKFGIGFDINWVISHRGQNVIYVKDAAVNHIGNVISKMLIHLSIDKKSPDFPRKYMHEIVYATENMKWRNEREWRIISDKSGQADFTFADIKSLVCPKSHEKELKEFLELDAKYVGLKEKMHII
ncbi:MAG: abortive infection system antitoxin AbiGi family protein [Pseudobdellovibrio sp.]